MYDVMRKVKENMTPREKRTSFCFTLGIALSLALALTVGVVSVWFFGINDWFLLTVVIAGGTGGVASSVLQQAQKKFFLSTEWATNQWSQKVADATIEPPIFAWEPNALSIFQTLQEAEAYFEPWIVEEPEEFFDVRGAPLMAIPHMNHVILRLNPEFKGEGPARLREILLKRLQVTKIAPAGAEELDLSALVAAVLTAHPFQK